MGAWSGQPESLGTKYVLAVVDGNLAPRRTIIKELPVLKLVGLVYKITKKTLRGQN